MRDRVFSQAPALALAAGVVLLLDALRAWLPSVLLVFGRAGSTPATQMGLFALVPFLVALGVAVLASRLPARPLAVGAAAMLVAARLGVQATAGGQPQLWLSTLAVLAGLILLIATAARGTTATAAAFGVVAGLGVDATVLALLRSAALPWRPGLWPWLAVGALGAVLVWAQVRSATSSERADREDLDVPATAAGWFVVGPALVLHGILTGMPARVHTLTDWSEPLAAAAVVAGHGLALLLVWRISRGPGLAPAIPRALLYGGFACVILAPLAAGAGRAGLAAGGQVLLASGIGAAIGVVMRDSRRRWPSRPALACAGGLLAFVALTFLYYAGYDIVLGFPNWLVLLAATVLVAPPWRRPPTVADPRPVPTGLIQVAAVAVLIAVLGLSASTQAVSPDRGEGLPVRVMLYNVQFGYDVDGAQAVDAQAEVIAAERPDLVVLNEVSRGWLVQGSVDVLPRIAERLGYPYVFAPAADEVWGNAILSRYPILFSSQRFLPREGTPMRRSVVSVIVDAGDEEIAVVATHLHHRREDPEVRRAQAQVVAQEARDLADSGRPVIVVGDLNAPADASELEPLWSWLDDMTASFPAFTTWPSWDPAEHIDQVFATPGLVPSDLSVPDTTASDHLAVAVTLSRQGDHAP